MHLRSTEIRRRDFLTAFTAVLVFPKELIGDQSDAAGPILWSAGNDKAVVTLFGFSDAKDRSWLTPKIKRAFEESTEIWFETPQRDPSAHEAKNDAPKGPSLADQLGHDPQHSLFDVLEPSVASRTLEVAKELGVPRTNLEHLRPWLAYYVINNAFRAKYVTQASGASTDSEVPDRVLAGMAFAAHKTVRSEYPDRDALIRSFANLSDKAAGEHLEDLLDYIQDEKAGLNKAVYGWITGHPSTRDIERMRRTRPELYQAMHVERNQEWARRISGFLSTGGTYFVCIGMNHVQGPDSILHYLQAMSISPTRVS